MFRIARVSIRYPLNGLRVICTSNEKISINSENNAVPSMKFNPIYKFPYIRACSLVNRLKLYQTYLTAVALPSSVILNQISLVSKDAVLVTLVLGASGSLILYSLGYLAEKFIGFVYLSEDGNTVKVSFVDFWGNRKDVLVPLQDIVPLSDLPALFTDGLYFRFTRFSGKDHLRLCLKFGIVLDKDGFNKIFN